MRKKAVKLLLIGAMLMTVSGGCSADKKESSASPDGGAYESVKDETQETSKTAKELTADEIFENQKKYREALSSRQGERITSYLPPLDEEEEPTEYEYTVYDFNKSGELTGMKTVVFYSDYERYEHFIEDMERYGEEVSFKDDMACYYEIITDSSDVTFTQNQVYGYDGIEMLERDTMVYNPVHKFVYTDNAVVKEEGSAGNASEVQAEYLNHTMISEYTRDCQLVGYYVDTLIYETTYYDAEGNVAACGRAYCAQGQTGFDDILANCKINGVPVLIRDDAAGYLETYATEGFSGFIVYSPQ